ncbi:spore germination protein [Cohnella thailandensis]|uniref:Spore germination protein n=1 Tax=Cohnella thailandensis TaxID=557557 RepID=A0A841T2P7_9BACL|nr:spore germination protein [Cohnella thailandensis]MBB6638414.1 spore germination protein [Cohnella thailandensis]MBP1977108.1 spore germination protein KA [Cohnella thailandensis]
MATYRFRQDRIENELRAHFGSSADLSLIPIRLADRDGLLCFLSTMTNSTFLMNNVVQPLLQASYREILFDSAEALDSLRLRLFGGLNTRLLEDPGHLPEWMTQGYAGLLLDGQDRMLLIHVQELEKRSIAEPTAQNVIRGPKEAFTESADTNMSMIRRRILNENLRFEKHVIGSKSNTSVYLAYLEGEADERLLNPIREKLRSARLTGLFDSGGLENELQSNRFYLFPTTYNSERPDSICSCLLDKRVALIVNGSPFVLIIPAQFTDFFKSPEDQYQWFVFGTFIRLLRYVAFLFSLTLPAFYVAVTCYHQELVPTLLLTSIMAQRQGIPFPAVVEMFLMEITFELLREAGTRMPRLVGQSISIAGALVLGEAAVQAGIVSNITVIIVALTAISGYVSPVYTFGANIRLFRFALIVLSSVIGLYGVILGCAYLLIHLTRIETFGVPYLSPLSRFSGKRSA